jgi:hypothetical protein
VIKSRRLRDVERIGEMMNTYRNLVGKLKGKRSLGRPRYEWKSDITLDLREIEWYGVHCYIWRRIVSDSELL